MMILNNVILVLTSTSVVFGVVSIIVAFWAIITHRERYYKEQKKMFQQQLDRVRKDIEKRRSTNGE